MQFQTKPGMMRLFIALEVPDEWKDAICRNQVRFSFGRWTPREQIHLTVRFLGDVSSGKTEELVNCFRVAKRFAGSVPFIFDGIGMFPNQKNARSMHIRLAPAETMLSLKRNLDDDLQKISGIPSENRFIPHITIMRMRHGLSKPDCEHLAEWGLNLKLPETKANRLTLFRSYFENRLIHEPLADIILDNNVRT